MSAPLNLKYQMLAHILILLPLIYPHLRAPLKQRFYRIHVIGTMEQRSVNFQTPQLSEKIL